MTLQNVVTFDILSYYDGKIKNWVKALKATAEQDGIMTKEDFSKLAGIASGAQVNVIESVKVDGTALTPDANKAVNINLSGKAEKSEMSVVAGTGDDADKTTITLKSGTSATVLTTHQNISGKADVVSGATAGNFAGLDASGNLTDSGSKASDFKTKQTAVVDPTASGNATAFIDSISQDANGEITVTKKNIPTVTASVSGQGGNNGLMTAAQAEALAAIDYSGKADKDTDAVEGNFAAFDANGNPVDSGHKHSDYQAAGSYKTTQTAVNDPTVGSATDTINFIATISQNANGEISATKQAVRSASATQSGLMSSSDYSKLAALPTNSDLNTALNAKADKVASATSGHFAGLDANGNLTDSGKEAADFATATQGGYADSALQSISNGTDGSYVTTTIGSKSGNAGAKDQTVGVAVTVQAVSTADASHMGLVEASDVKSYIDNKVASGINYKGSVQKYSNLPASPEVGDMYNVKEDETISGQFYPGDMNYIWAAASGTSGDPDYVPAHWDPQSPIITITTATTTQVDGLFS